MKFYMMLCLQIAQTGTDKCIKNIFNHLEMRYKYKNMI